MTTLSDGAHAAEGAFLAPDPAWIAIASVHQRLLERRRTQRGVFTYGDSFDADFARALAAVSVGPTKPAAPLEAWGEELGRLVYARRMFEDSFRGAFIVLSASLTASGFGSLEVRDAFHRTALVGFEAAPDLAAAQREAIDAYLVGVLRGFMAEAFNCDAHARAVSPRTYEVRLGEGRNANRRAEP